MKWLLNLYPPAWQRRYRTEMEAQFDADLPAFRTALDLLAGAVDAWLHPEWIAESRPTTETETMLTASRCGSPDISTADALRSAGWMIGLSLALSAIGVYLDKTLGDNLPTNALLHSAFFIAFTVSCTHTFLKPYSRAARNVIAIGGSVGWYLFFLSVGALAAAI